MSTTVSEIRDKFACLRRRQVAGQDVEVAGTLELIGSSFTADEPTIFGTVDEDYVMRELHWYLSQSLMVNDIPGGPPKIWEDVAADDGTILSNYGQLLLSAANGSQAEHVLEHLHREPNGRRAVAIYTRPFIHDQWNENGRKDFICTNAVNYYLREGKLNAVVQMRSNDAVFGFRNDYAWQSYVLQMLADELLVETGSIIWQPGSLHVYSRHYHLIDTYIATGEWNVPVRRNS